MVCWDLVTYLIGIMVGGGLVTCLEVVIVIISPLFIIQSSPELSSPVLQSISSPLPPVIIISPESAPPPATAASGEGVCIGSVLGGL